MRKTPQHFRDQIDSLGIPKRDTVGLRVASRAPVGFNTVNGYFVCNGKVYAREDYEGSKAVGLYIKVGGYFSRKGDVHVVKGSTLYSLVHEIGHHVTLTLNDNGDIVGKLVQILEYLERKGSPWQLGLRTYSLKSWKELLADSYAVRYTSARGWEKLVSFFDGWGVDIVAATAA